MAPRRPAPRRRWPCDRSYPAGLLDETGVALVSGTSFGILGEGYIRFSDANSIANIEAAIDRIARFLER